MFVERSVISLNGSGFGGSLNVNLDTPVGEEWEVSAENYLGSVSESDYNYQLAEIRARTIDVTQFKIITPNVADLFSFIQVLYTETGSEYIRNYNIESVDSKKSVGYVFNEKFNLNAFTEISLMLPPNTKITLLLDIEKTIIEQPLLDYVENQQMTGSGGFGTITEIRRTTIEEKGCNKLWCLALLVAVAYSIKKIRE